jgi:glycosyltransferase involved in cell wall biosynthesis
MANLAITRTEDLSDAMREFTKRLARYNADLSKKRGVFYRREFDLTFCAHLDEIYAISEFSRDNARTIYGRCREEVIYPIVRFPEGGHTRRGLDRSGLKILVHGRLEIFKNVDTVIRGFARFFAQHSGAHLHVVGEGPHRKRLENLAVELAPGGATFHGFLPDERLREIYEVCDVFALLPLDEPFGMVFPEAAAKGLLLVGPDHGGPLEILDGGRLGWVCNPFSPEELAGIFDRIWALDDAEVDRRRIEADYACRSRYSESAVTPKLMDVLKR